MGNCCAPEPHRKRQRAASSPRAAPKSAPKPAAPASRPAPVAQPKSPELVPQPASPAPFLDAKEEVPDVEAPSSLADGQESDEATQVMIALTPLRPILCGSYMCSQLFREFLDPETGSKDLSERAKQTIREFVGDFLATLETPDAKAEWEDAVIGRQVAAAMGEGWAESRVGGLLSGDGAFMVDFLRRHDRARELLIEKLGVGGEPTPCFEAINACCDVWCRENGWLAANESQNRLIRRQMNIQELNLQRKYATSYPQWFDIMTIRKGLFNDVAAALFSLPKECPGDTECRRNASTLMTKALMDLQQLCAVKDISFLRQQYVDVSSSLVKALSQLQEASAREEPCQTTVDQFEAFTKALNEKLGEAIVSFLATKNPDSIEDQGIF
eukprot:TRINITY_DN17875_c0_g1_i1.p1 TRINITY_DN17875_c0_g1~~TRINITY_DN17875_c0_g1_i1.p1  ORF type:complete len:385 (+),score=87.05 TRINITY_DN17875_c0_g1_i1:83-1237(+)